MKILVVAGSSGGHIFPALGLLDTLREKHKNVETLLVLPNKNTVNQIRDFGYRIDYISTGSIKLTIDFKNAMAILSFFKGALESAAILCTFRPDMVVGFGTLACVPMIMFARLFGMKTLIHEQNVIPGRANRFLAIFSNRIAVSFGEANNYFKFYKKKTIVTGSPLRKDLVRLDKNKAIDFFGLNKDKFTILIMGGSQGSRSINLLSLRAISEMSDKSRLQIIHLAGDKDYDFLKRSYKDLKVNLRLFVFLEAMQYAYSACDLVLSRGGAGTIAEIMFFRLPAIIIPYPFAYKHQIANARMLEKIGSAVVLQEDGLGADTLKEAIDGFINNPDRIKAMRSCYHGCLIADANKRLADSVLTLN